MPIMSGVRISMFLLQVFSICVNGLEIHFRFSSLAQKNLENSCPPLQAVAGSQQIGFLLGNCGVTVALTSEACLKGLPKSSTGEVMSFKGWPKLGWLLKVYPNLPRTGSLLRGSLMTLLPMSRFSSSHSLLLSAFPVFPVKPGALPRRKE